MIGLTKYRSYPAEAAQPYAYAGDDPVNEGDPSGKLTLGICGTFGLGFIVNASYSGCLTRMVNPSNGRGSGMAFVSSPAGGFGFDFSANVGVAQSVSNASTLQNLAGPFVFAELGVEAGGGAAIQVYFSAPGTQYKQFVYGVEFGVSAGAGVDLYLGEEKTTVAGLGIFRGAADVLWDATAAPLSYVASFLTNGPTWLEQAEKVYQDHEKGKQPSLAGTAC